MGYTEIMTFEESRDRSKFTSVTEKGITQTDIAAIIGVGSYTVHQIWMYKVGEYVPREQKLGNGFDPIFWKRRLCDVVADEFSVRENKILKQYGVIQNDENPLMLSVVAYLVEGENAGVSPIMTDKMIDTEVEGHEENLYIYMNCQWNMAVTGCDRWYVPILYNNKQFFYKVIERNAGDIEMLKQKATEFWRANVRLRRPPDADESISCGQLIRAEFKGGVKKRAIIEEGEYEILIDDLLKMKNEMTSLRKHIREKENKLKMKLGNTEKAYVGKYFVQWVPQKKWRLDYDRVKGFNRQLFFDSLVCNMVRPLEISVRKEVD